MEWFAKPSTERLPLPGDNWVDVRKELTKGERDKMNAMLIKEVRSDGRMTPDFEMMSKAEAMAYIVDWSLTMGGERVDIGPDVDDPKKLAALNDLRGEAFDVLSDAIKAFIEAQDAQRPTKKATRGGKRSSVTSASAA